MKSRIILAVVALLFIYALDTEAQAPECYDTPTPTSTRTSTPTVTPTNTVFWPTCTPVPTKTQSPTKTPSPTNTPKPSPTATVFWPTCTPDPTPTNTATPYPTNTATSTPVPTEEFTIYLPGMFLNYRGPEPSCDDLLYIYHNGTLLKVIQPEFEPWPAYAVHITHLGDTLVIGSSDPIWHPEVAWYSFYKRLWQEGQLKSWQCFTSTKPGHQWDQECVDLWPGWAYEIKDWYEVGGNKCGVSIFYTYDPPDSVRSNTFYSPIGTPIPVQ